MSLEKSKAVVDRFLGYDYEVLSEDAVAEVVGLGLRAVGSRAIQQLSNRFYHDMFEAEANIRNVIIGESHGVVELEFIGTHRGEFCGVPGTGRPIHVPAVAIYDISDEQMTGLRFFLPVNLIMEQIRGRGD